MNWYKISNRKKIFVGDCITGLENSHFQDTIGVYDATDLAQMVANGNRISFDKFLNMVELYHNYDFDFKFNSIINIEDIEKNPENYEFYFSPEKNIAWFENLGEGVEYFYA